MRVPHTENSACSAFEEYKEVPKNTPLYFTEDYVMWVVSKISCAADTLGAEDIELKYWLIRFGFALEELRFVIAKLSD